MSLTLLFELMIKSGVVTAIGLALATLLHFRPAPDRVDVLRATVCLLIALPVLMVVAPGLEIPVLPASAAGSAGETPAVWAGAVGPVAGMSLSGSVLRPSLGEVLVWAYAVGAAVVIGRFGLGVWTLRRWTRNGKTVTHPAWTAPLNRLGARVRPRLVASAAVSAPLSWGVPPGVVLIGPDQLRRADTAPAVLAHELAHLRRGDWIFLALSRLALGLFWFNPLVWLLHAALAARSEEAADAAALTEIDSRTYARTLVSLAADFRQQPAALGMAGPAQTLTRRIACIMKSQRPHTPRPVAMALMVGALIVVATPIAAVELTPRVPQPPAAPEAPSAPPAPVPPAVPAAPAVSIAPAAPMAPAWLQVAPPEPPAPPEAPQPPEPIYDVRPPTEQERHWAVEARRHADAARVQARVQVAAANEARTQARLAAAGADEARAQAHVAREQAARAMADARVQMAHARVQMAQGADQMESGAGQMREESRRLRDPAYRAGQIERARERGDVVTDAELQALSPRLTTQADELEQRAVEMRERSAQPL